MDFSNLLYIIALLACPIGMGAMMWVMSKNMNSQQQSSSVIADTADATATRLEQLRAQRQTLEAEIAEVTKLAELEAQREALLHEERVGANTTS